MRGETGIREYALPRPMSQPSWGGVVDAPDDIDDETAETREEATEIRETVPKSVADQADTRGRISLRRE